MRLDRDAIAKLQARSLPHMRAEMILAADNPSSTEAVRLLAVADEYLRAFVVSAGRKCICCGLAFAGTMFDILGGFRWGIANGEGECRDCGYPARAIHRIPEVGTLSYYVLQYHPSGLSFEPASVEVSP